jgi:predicted nucleic acid-binding protein
LAFDLKLSLRRLKPEKRIRPLRSRTDASLPFVTVNTPPARNLMIDTCVYIDAARGKMPPEVTAFVAASQIHHCSVCLGELAFALGRLDPRDARSHKPANFIAETLMRIPGHRVAEPDDEVFIEAGIAAGVLARTQDYTRDARRKLLNDALALMTARKQGLAVLTANVADFDLLSQLRPDAKLIYYRPV